jgi:hypothetical protein
MDLRQLSCVESRGRDHHWDALGRRGPKQGQRSIGIGKINDNRFGRQMGFNAVADRDPETPGAGDFAGVFADARAAGPVDGGDELEIARLLDCSDDGAAHSPADAANDEI